MKQRNAAQEGEEPNEGGEGKGVSRRTFLQTMAAGAVATKLDPPPRMMEEPARASAHPNAAAADTVEVTEPVEAAEHERGLSTALDMGTASLIAARFFQNVVAPGLKEAFPNATDNIFAKLAMGISSGNGLDSGTAAELNLLALARIELLAQFGGEEGGHLAHHELEEIIGGLIPLPVLVALSDFTNEALKVNEKAMMAANDNTTEEQEGDVKKKAQFIEKVEAFMRTETTEDYSSVARPGLGATQAEWEAHAEKVGGDISKKVGQIVAITSVMAPLGTTYSSSILANEMKQSVLRMLYEHAYAKQVIQKKQQGDTLLEANYIQDAAIAEADELFNGNFGFSKLMLTLAANTQGSFGLGDPPEIYFLINNIDNPEVLAKGHALGALNSEVYSNALTALWLKKAGVGVGSSLKELFTAQIKTISGLAQTFADSDLRDVSFNDGRKIVEKIKSALNDESDPTGELRKTLDAIPEAKLQASVRNYFKRKLALMTGLQSKIDSIPDLSVLDKEKFGDSDLWQDLINPAADAKQTEKLARATMEKIQGAQGEKLAGFMELLMSKATEEQGGEAHAEGVSTDIVDDESVSKVGTQMRALEELKRAFTQPQRASKKDRISAAMKFLGFGPDSSFDPNAFFKALSEADETTCRRAVQILTEVSPGEHDSIKGEAHDAEAGDTIEKGLQHHDAHAPVGKNKFKQLLEDNSVIGALNHNAKEVLWALLTQIPSVPALVRIAKKMLPAMVGVRPGEKPTPNQLKAIVGLTLTLTATMSGVADNVAAYMFCRTVLFDFFEETFGESFESNEELRGEIDIIACKGAEQGGSLTKVGNGPNFSQKRLVLVKDDSNQQGVSIDIQDMTMGETLKNGFSLVANGSYIAIGTAYLCSGITKLEADNDNRKAASVDETVIGRRQLVRGFYERVTGGGKKTA